MSRGANGHNMVKGSVDYATFENQVLRLDLARTDDVDNVESALKFKDVRAYRESVPSAHYSCCRRAPFYFLQFIGTALLS